METKAEKRARLAPSGKIIRVLCAMMLACGLVPAVSPDVALASEVKYIGEVANLISYDENGFPIYNEDGTPKRDAYVSLYDIENASGTVQLPSSFDVTVRDGSVQESVVENVVPYEIDLKKKYESGSPVGWSNTQVTGIDLSQCSTLSRVSCDELPAVESLDLHGLDQLQRLTIYSCASLASLDVSGCSSLSEYFLTGTEHLDLPDFEQEPWPNLTKLSISKRGDFTSLEGSQLPNLTYLSISTSGLTSLDVSACSALESLSVQDNANLKELDAASIPQGVTYFSCCHNSITDTTALVERFGKDQVLPQGVQSRTGLWVVHEAAAEGTFLVGGSCSFSLPESYTPSQGDESSNYYAENSDDRNAPANFRASSSDGSVATVSIDEGSSSLVVQATGSGSATLTIDYSFEGKHGTYRGQQVIEFTVAAASNPITIIDCPSSVDVPMFVDCPCGQPVQPSTFVPLDLALQDSSRPVTSDVQVVVATSNESVVSAQLETDPQALGVDGDYALRLFPRAVGEATVTLQSTVQGSGAAVDLATIAISVVASDSPTLTVQNARTVYDEGSFIISPGGHGLASYEDDEALELFTSCHAGGFQNGAPTLGDVTVVSATSSNEEVASVTTQRGMLRLETHKPGTTDVTIKDMWGNEGTCAVTVGNRADEVSKLSLSQSELTIKQGETFDLATLVQGIGDIDPSAVLGELLVFKSDNGYVAPIAWNWEGLGGYYHVSSMLGRNVGDASITAYMLIGDDHGGSMEHLDAWEVAEFGQLTVHVVDDTEANPATNIEITGDATSVALGSTLQLSAAITPTDADNADELVWSSSDEAVATVDETGKVTPIGLGKTTVTAALGSLSDTYEVTVVPQAIPATDVTVSDAPTSLKVGETAQLSASVVPADATDKVVWSSSDAAVLVVDQSGMVTAAGNGTARITAAAGGVSASTASINVTTPVSGVTLGTSSLDVYMGTAGSQLVATVVPETASNKTVSWSSSDERIVTVDGSGNVSPVAVGTAVVTAASEDGGFTATCTVTVAQHVDGLSLDKHKLALIGAASDTLKATVSADNATNKGVTWLSSDASVATVDADGKVASVGKGEAVITATSEDGSYQDACTVVVANPIKTIELKSDAVSLIKGESTTIAPVCKGALPGAVDVPTSVGWSSSNENVAGVQGDRTAGVVSALKSGGATITLHVSTQGSIDLGGGVSADYDVAADQTCTVTVSNPVQSITLSKTAETVVVGDTEHLSLTATVNPADADDVAVAWTSSDTGVATVDAAGKVSIHKAGSTFITAAAGGKSATCALTVQAKTMASTPGDSRYAARIEASDSATAKALESLAGENGLNLMVATAENLTHAAQQVVESLKANGETIAEVFDIFLADNGGNEVSIDQATGELSITVKVKMTESMRALDAKTLKVSYVGDDGLLEEKETWVDGDLLCFKTSHFSTYVVTGEMPKGSEAAAGQNWGEGDASVATSKMPPTSDPLALTALLGMAACIVSIGTAAFARRKAQ